MSKSMLLKGVGIFFLGLVTVLWCFVKIWASIVVSVFLANMYGFSGYTWWAFVIIIFSVICKFLFYGRDLSDYKKMIEDYQLESKSE